MIRQVEFTLHGHRFIIRYRPGEESIVCKALAEKVNDASGWSDVAVVQAIISFISEKV